MGCTALRFTANKNQHTRSTSLPDFKSASCPWLIATDVAARGLDVPIVEAVIRYTFPLMIEDYVHRIGRTGRAGKTGIRYAFFQPGDKTHAGVSQETLKQVWWPIPDASAKFGKTIKRRTGCTEALEPRTALQSRPPRSPLATTIDAKVMCLCNV
jgi:ATP-dependent RNA helicase DBP3